MTSTDQNLDEIKKSNPVSNATQLAKKYKGEIGLAVLILYVFLLGLGTIGELWDIEWILDLPLFRPPGKY